MDLTMDITIVDSYQWNLYGYEKPYNDLAFNQKTGWGDWLKINTVAPIDNPDPLKVIGATPSDDDASSEPSVELQIEYILDLIGKN
jgi:hypothetical protein